MPGVKKKYWNVNDDFSIITTDTYTAVVRMAQEYKEVYIPINIQKSIQRKFLSEAAKCSVKYNVDFKFAWMEAEVTYTFADFVGFHKIKIVDSTAILKEFGGKTFLSKVMEDSTKNIVTRMSPKLTDNGRFKVRFYRYSATRPEHWDFKKNFEEREMSMSDLINGRYSFRTFIGQEVEAISEITGVDYTKRMKVDFV